MDVQDEFERIIRICKSKNRQSQWPKEKGQTDIQWSMSNTNNTINKNVIQLKIVETCVLNVALIIIIIIIIIDFSYLYPYQ